MCNSNYYYNCGSYYSYTYATCSHPYYSPSYTSTTSSSSTSTSSSLSGAIAGGVVGLIIFIAVIVGLIVYFRRRQLARQAAGHQAVYQKNAQEQTTIVIPPTQTQIPQYPQYAPNYPVQNFPVYQPTQMQFMPSPIIMQPPPNQYIGQMPVNYGIQSPNIYGQGYGY
jgi:hypothetical protein